VRQDGMADSRLLPHAQSLSFGGGDPAAQPGFWDEVVAGHLHQSKSHYGEQRQETAEQKAEQLLKAELAKLGWKEESLSMVAKSHPVKVQLARRLRKETTMSLKWIAARLQMGTWTYVSNLLHAAPSTQRPSQGPSQDLLPLCQ
jgi:hypothetical protein